ISNNSMTEYAGSRSVRPVFSACAAAAVYLRDCLEAVKLGNGQYFDNLYFAYYEDIDLSIRLNAAGFKGVSVPTAVVYHKHSRTAGASSALKAFYSEKNRMLNIILNYPFYLMITAEIFFAVKVIILLFLSLSGRKGRGRDYMENVGIFHMIIIFVKARLWIAANLIPILKDRGGRKRKGLVLRDIYARSQKTLF
ncbi:MAG: hypothetical protein ABH885_03665, partial [Candidatus Omnitrophota bacterium]